jgi:signal transduction histidine kinase
MSAPSLRARLILGAVFWSAGLFLAVSAVLVRLMERHPGAPVAVHDLLRNVPAIALVSVACLVAGVWAVGGGIAAVQRLRGRLAAVHAGTATAVGGHYPSEVQPLVDDLNALIAEREERVQRALARAGDLAHGLKTPLAVLAREVDRLAVSAGGDDAAGDAGASALAEIARMRRQIDYHLAHARAAASAGTGAAAPLAASVEGLVRALRRLHADRGLTFTIDVPAGLEAACAAADLDEMLGNLLDNACAWARGQVSLRAEAGADRIAIHVDDDGPGLDAATAARVMQRGVRADESVPGSGLGLSIVQDIAAVHGGDVVLARAPLGGLRATLRIPRRT